MSWTLEFTEQSVKDATKLKRASLWKKAKKLLSVLETNPFQNPPPFEKLIGDLAGAYSRRINIQHRLVYFIFQEAKIVRVLRMWSHYE